MPRYDSLLTLPEISDPSANMMDSIIKTATIMEKAEDRQRKFGSEPTAGTPDTPATPSIVTATRPGLIPAFSGYKKITALPENIPAGSAQIDPEAVALLEQGKPVYYKPGKPSIAGIAPTPGVLGTDEIAVRAALLDQVDPADKGTFMTKPGKETYQEVKYKTTAPKLQAMYNPYTGKVASAEQFNQLDDIAKQDYYQINQEDAVKEAGDYKRAMLAADKANMGYLMQTYLSTFRKPSWEKTADDKALEKGTRKMLVELIGADLVVKTEKSILSKKQNDYDLSLNNALSIGQQIEDSQLSSSEKIEKRKGVINKLKSAYRDEGYYNITNKQEQSYIRTGKW